MLFGICTHLFYSQKHFTETCKCAACFCPYWEQDLFHLSMLRTGFISELILVQTEEFSTGCVRCAVLSVSPHVCTSDRAYRALLSSRETPVVIPASPLYTDGRRFPPFWQLPSVCGVIQVTISNNSLYFLFICCFFSILAFSGSASHQAGAQSMELENLQYPEPWRWCDREKGTVFSTNTFYVNVSMRDEIQEVHMQFLHEPFEVFIHIVEKKMRNTQNLFCSSALPTFLFLASPVLVEFESFATCFSTETMWL